MDQTVAFPTIVDDVELHIGFETVGAAPGIVAYLELEGLENIICEIKQFIPSVRAQWPTTKVFQVLVLLPVDGRYKIHFYRADETDESDND